MHLSIRPARRALAAFAVTCAAILIPTAALAAPGGPASAARSADASAAAPPRCTVSALQLWLGVPGDGYAGGTAYQLELSNVSGRACTLYGFPGVSAIGTNGRQIGRAAQRDYADPVRLVTLGRGATAHVLLRITDVADFPAASCQPATAVWLRIYPPNDFRSMVVPFTFRGCQKGGAYLFVRTTVAGTGIPGFSN